MGLQMLENFFSETYLPKLEEDAKTLKLDASIYKEKFAEWDAIRAGRNRFQCTFNPADIPYVLCYLKSHPNFTSLELTGDIINLKIIEIFTALKTRPLILRDCMIADGIISYFLKYYTFTELEIYRCRMRLTDTVSLLNNSALKTFVLYNSPLAGINLHALSSNSTITSLTLRRCKIDSKKVGFLSKYHVLETLNLNENPQIRDEGAQALSLLPTVTSLSLAECNIGPKGADFLSKNSVLKTLVLSDNPLRDKGAHSLSFQPTVTSLELSACKIGPNGANFLSKNPVLKTLNLGENPLKGKGIRALSFCANLTSLDLTDSNIDVIKAVYFLNCLALKTLVLDYNPLGDEGADWISRISTVTDLSLIECKISSQGASYFLRNPHLEILNLGENPIRDEGADSLSNHPALTDLDLSQCSLGDRGATALARNSRFTKLTLSFNDIVYWGAIALAFNQSIQKLGLSAHKIDSFAIFYFLGNQTLKEFEGSAHLETTIFEFVTNRNSLFQSQYPEAVKKELSEHFPEVLTSIIQDYTKGEFPFSFQLFHDHRPRLGYRDNQDHLISELRKISFA